MSWPPLLRSSRVNPPDKTVAIIIPVRDDLAYFKLAFHSILSFTDKPFVLAVLDNMGQYSTRIYLKQLANNHAISVIPYQKDFDQADMINLAFDHFSAFPNVVYGCAVHSDIVVSPGWLSKLLNGIGESDSAVPNLVGWKDTGGTCLLFKRSSYESIGKFANKNGNRVGNSYGITQPVSDVTVYHFGKSTLKGELSHESN